MHRDVRQDVLNARSKLLACAVPVGDGLLEQIRCQAREKVTERGDIFRADLFAFVEGQHRPHVYPLGGPIDTGKPRVLRSKNV
jgi:hypothetical protein